MNWYYAQGKERLGPVEDNEFQRLLQQGVITAETLVWRDGMSGWQPRKQVTVAGTVLCAACQGSVAEADSFLLGEKPYCSVCKPLILQRIQEGKPLPVSNAEETRRKYLNHEASVKSIGVLYYLTTAFLVWGGIDTLIHPVAKSGRPMSVGVVAFFLVLAAVFAVTGTGLRRLQGWARIPTGILATLGLLAFPVGTIINAYVLYLIFSEKGSMVFSPGYREIMAATPHIKYKMSIVVWVLLGLVLLLIALGVGVAVLSKH